jgi:hypothetical protein
LTLLAYNYSPKLKEVHDYSLSLKSSDSNYPPEHVLGVYDKYTDRELSAELKQAVTNGLIDDVKTKLGVTAENESPYELRVLSIGSHMTSNGIQAPNATQEIKDVINGWQNGLKDRKQEFGIERGHQAIAPAWATEINGQVYLFVDMFIAEKILHPDVTAQDPSYGERERKADRAVLMHEYVHTQGGLNQDRELDFGLGLEELRAEEFSGNHFGYNDIKYFSQDLHVLTGRDLIAYFESKPKGGTPFEVYSGLASDIGLDRMLEVLMVLPHGYESEYHLLSDMIVDHIGGYDEIAARILEDKLKQGNGAEIEHRLDERATYWLEVLNPDWADRYIPLRKAQGSILLTQMTESRMAKLKS